MGVGGRLRQRLAQILHSSCATTSVKIMPQPRAKNHLLLGARTSSGPSPSMAGRGGTQTHLLAAHHLGAPRPADAFRPPAASARRVSTTRRRRRSWWTARTASAAAGKHEPIRGHAPTADHELCCGAAHRPRPETNSGRVPAPSPAICELRRGHALPARRAAAEDLRRSRREPRPSATHKASTGRGPAPHAIRAEALRRTRFEPWPRLSPPAGPPPPAGIEREDPLVRYRRWVMHWMGDEVFWVRQG